MEHFTHLIVGIALFACIGCSESRAVKAEVKTRSTAIILDGSTDNDKARSDQKKIDTIGRMESLKSSAFMNYHENEKGRFLKGTLSEGQVHIFNNSSFIRIEGTIEIKTDSLKSKTTRESGHVTISNTIRAAKTSYYMIAYTMLNGGNVKREIAFLRENNKPGAGKREFSSNTDEPQRTEQGIFVGEIPAGEHVLHISSDAAGADAFSKIIFSAIIREK